MISRPLVAGAVLWLGVGTVPATAQAPPPGRYAGGRGVTLTLDGAGRYAFADGARTLSSGAYGVEGATLLLRDSAGPAICAQAGRYGWRLAGDTLRFEATDDACAGRRAALTAGPWVRLRDALALTGVTLIDGTGAPPRPGMTLVLRDGRIAALYRDGDSTPPADATVRRLAGHWVLPGLIDTHVHLATNPSEPGWRERTERLLRNALLGGVLAVRDMGGDGRALADLARAATVGDLTAPEIRYSAIMAGPDFFDDRRVRSSSAGVPIGTAPWARLVTETTDLRQIVAEARGTGATGLKLYQALDARAVGGLAAEGRRQGLRAWGHLALFPARPSEVVASGLQVVSHALFFLMEPVDTLGTERPRQFDLSIGADHPAVARTIALMREHDVIFEPTLWVFRADPALPDTSVPRRIQARAADFTRAAHQAGVRIAAGTDGIGSDSAGILPNLHAELALLVELGGLSPMEALVAATRTAAEAAGVERTHGTVAVGKAADLLVLGADPTADIRNTRKIAFVVRRGTVVER